MSFTFLDQQGKLSRLIGDPNTDTTDQWPLADRKKELNRGEMNFCTKAKLVREYSSSTVSGMVISLPSDWLETEVLYILNGSKWIKITNDRELSVRDLERYGDYAGDLPYYYVWEVSGTRKIFLLGSTAINGRTYKLFYKKKPSTELSADADTGILPEEFREACAYYAASELLRQIGKNQLADTYYQRFLDYVREGQDEAEKMYLAYDQPRPDLNQVDTTIQDVQGGGIL